LLRACASTTPMSSSRRRVLPGSSGWPRAPISSSSAEPSIPAAGTATRTVACDATGASWPGCPSPSSAWVRAQFDRALGRPLR